MSKGSVLSALALGAVLVTSAAARAADLTIGLVMAQTGPYAFAGAPAAKGAQLAAEEINASGVLGNDKVVLLSEDNGGDKTQALTLLNRFALKDHALLVLGPTSTVELSSFAELANSLQIPIFNHTYNQDVLKTGIWPFKITPPPAAIMDGIAQYTADKLSPKRAATITIRENSGYITQTNAFRDDLKARGVSIVSEETVLGSDSDFAAMSTKLAAMNLDTVFIGTPADIGANLILQLRQAGISPSVHFITGTSMASDAFLKAGGKAVEGVYVAADFVPGGMNDVGRAFAAAYQKKFGQEPDNWAAMGYGLMQLTGLALKQAEPQPTRDKVRAALAGLRNVPTVLGRGTFSFDDNRIASYGTAVLIVKDGKFVGAP